MIGDTYRIKYSDYVLNANGTDNGRYIEIDATDRVSRPGINTTNFITSKPVPLDITLYGYRSQGYGAPLWNNMFYLLENFAQPSEATSITPKYSKNTVTGQIWTDTSMSPPIARWYGRNDTFYKLGASVNIASSASQAAPGELWFDTSSYTFNFYNTGWGDINCIPYASQREYNAFVTQVNALTNPDLPLLTGTTKPTPANWATLLTAIRLLATSRGLSGPSAAVDAIAADNFMSCNASAYGIATIRSAITEIQTTLNNVDASINPPARLPLAGFTITATGIIPMVVQFTDTSTNTPTSWSWSFGDGGTSTARNPSHTYNAPGTYVIGLTVTNAAGTTSTQNILTGVATPVAAFMVGPDNNPDTSATKPYQVQFHDQSSNAPASWWWDFGDGITSSERNPLHTYTTQGDFTVKLTVTNVAGSHTATVTHAVKVGEAPIANFTNGNVVNPTASSLTVQFTDTSTKIPESWLWEFGDGTTSTAQHPSHTYTAWGRYTVQLTVTNPLGSTSITKEDLVVLGTLPIANFSLTPGTGLLPLTVQFTDTSINNPTSWAWNFGDGTTSTAQNPSHTYTTHGVRTISLTASNVIGASAQHSEAIVAGLAPVANFSTSGTTTGTPPFTTNFTDASANQPTSWLWNFGDGTTSTAQHPSHTYTTPGVYNVSLTASNPIGTNTKTLNGLIDAQIRNPIATQTVNTDGISWRAARYVQIGGFGRNGTPVYEWQYSGSYTGRPLTGHCKWPSMVQTSINGAAPIILPTATWAPFTMTVTNTSSVPEVIRLSTYWFLGVYNQSTMRIYRKTPTEVILVEQTLTNPTVQSSYIINDTLIAYDTIPAGQTYTYGLYQYSPWNGDYFYGYNVQTSGYYNMMISHYGWA